MIPHPNSISTGSAIFAGLTVVTDIDTDRQTRLHQDILSNSPHLVLMPLVLAMRVNNTDIICKPLWCPETRICYENVVLNLLKWDTSNEAKYFTKKQTLYVTKAQTLLINHAYLNSTEILVQHSLTCVIGITRRHIRQAQPMNQAVILFINSHIHKRGI